MPTSAVVLTTHNTEYLDLPLGGGPSAVQRLATVLSALHTELRFDAVYLLAPAVAMATVAELLRRALSPIVPVAPITPISSVSPIAPILVPISPSTAIAVDDDDATALRAPLDATAPLTATLKSTLTAAAAWRALFEAVPAANESAEHDLLCVWIDQPFLSPDLTRQLLAVHRAGWCDYTFADGYPIGYGPEIVRHGVLPAVAELAHSKQVPFGRSALFDSIAVDINAFDIETEVADHDYSLLREPLTCDTRRSYLCCHALAAPPSVANPPSAPPPAADARSATSSAPTEDPLLHRLRTMATAQRTVVSYLNVQVTCRSPQRPAYDLSALDEFAPCVADSAPLSVERFTALVSMVERANPEATIAIGYRGEPALHPDITALIAAVESTARLQLYVETCGIGWRHDDLQAIEAANLARTTFIVLLDAANLDVYRELRGSGYEEAYAFARRLLQRYPTRTFVQAVRTRETIEEVEAFYRHWKALTPNVIIQKYNDFAGLLPARRVADLSPLNRSACRHLQRDLTILSDGTVVQCMQDVRGSALRGNIFKSGLEAVWDAGLEQYRAHLHGVFAGICGQCDEYYTFNA